MNYNLLVEDFNYWNESSSKNVYNKELLDSLQKEEVIDMEIDFDAFIEKLPEVTVKSTYEDKHKALANLGYLLSHNSPSLQGYDEKLSANKELSDRLVSFWVLWESDEYVIDEYLEKVKKAIL